jgi:phosphate transport system substrate-binding protein
MIRLATKLALAASSVLLVTAGAQAAELTGAGSSFAAPIYSKWADAYQKATGNKLNYQSVGSGAGIKQINAKTVDFGASDMPLSPEELAKSGLIQFPTVIGGVVPVVNLPGVKPGQLKLSGQALAEIYLGKITKWNDAAIAQLNPGVTLPDRNIGVVRRADGSGTTYIFTDYLSKVSPEWKQKVGEGTAVQWPSGLGGKGNEGVSAFVQRLPGAIGYVEYAYAKQNHMTYVQMKNKDGNFVEPVAAAFKASAAGADWSHEFNTMLTDQPGKDTWPISGATFVLMHKVQDKPTQGAEVIKFFDWSYTNGDKLADELDYVPLPDSTVKLIRSAWAGVKSSGGQLVYQK